MSDEAAPDGATQGPGAADAEEQASYTPAEIEDRWRSRWAESGRYEADPDDPGEATFVTVPYPYPSGGMHVGHARTYTVPDAYARYRRQRGDNVLFPIAWHVTGTPIVGAVERLKAGEEDQLSTLRDTYNVPEATLEELETPMGYARYFIDEHYRKNMRALGLSIDWRRQFTTNDDHYSKFIEWQYRTLRDRGRLEQGLHPVKYCTNEQQPVTTHDLLEGEDADYQEYTLIMFSLEGDEEDTADPAVADAPAIPMATLRPETVRGVTNAFVDPEATYVRATVDGAPWIVGEPAAAKLRRQGRDVSVEEHLSGADLVGRDVRNPVTDERVPILPAGFVAAEDATGVVMSVPAHSPDDWVALEEAKADSERLREHGIDPELVAAIEPRAILSIEGYGEFPARDAVERFDVSSADDPALEEAVEEVYADEFHNGVLNDEYGEFGGKTVADVRDELRDAYHDRGAFERMYDFPVSVVCRCGGDVVVAERETWFLDYGDAEWSAAALDAVEQLDAVPESTRDQYTDTIDWLDAWPCIRNYGLGTRLPWDDEFVIEPLSDSTIYMAYYTIAHRITDLDPDDLDRGFFDTLFDGEPTAEAIEAGCDPEPNERALALREEWAHWYPVDVRCSANDLIRNHLTFFLYHHAELFDPEDWPEGITVMGMGLLEGEKMSSSKGHVVLPSEAIEAYGADTVRFYLLNSAEPWGDYDWRDDQVEHTHRLLERFWRRAVEVIETDADLTAAGERSIDRWLLSKLQGTVRTVTEAMDNYETRTATQAAFHEVEEHLRWYRRRTADDDRPGIAATRQAVLRTRLRLLAPFVPFLANELHERLTGEAADDAPWPAPDPERESAAVEVRETLVRDLTDDVASVLDVTGADPDSIHVYVAADWKRSVFDAVREAGGAEADQGAVMGQVMDDPDLRNRGDAVNALVGDLIEFAREDAAAALDRLAAVDELDVYTDAAGFLEREFDAAVDIHAEDTDPPDPGDAAGDAIPFRPAIYVE
jgi:leucyl-tRNA synthetase